MQAREVLDIYCFLDGSGVHVWIDGGWCIDALAGQISRDHSDLDIAVEHGSESRLLDLLAGQGFQVATRPDTTDANYVLRSPNGWDLDVHVFEYDSEGHNVYGIEYPMGSLAGTGQLGGKEVRCIAPDWIFRFKTSYEPKAKDIADVRLLAETFGFEVPEGY